MLINSNFSCGYFIHRERLYDVLRNKYRINSAYDPCSYPGIQSEFYYDPDSETQTGRQSLGEDGSSGKRLRKVSFMMFRTGSVLIVGKCCEEILNKIYRFLVELLEREYHAINCGPAPSPAASTPKRVVRKRTITVRDAS